MILDIEQFKALNLVDFISHYCNVEFKYRRGVYSCCSPLTGESNPSFFVRFVNGHWIFKDFSSNTGGTIFDFVQIKENLPTFSDALRFLRDLFSSRPLFLEKGADEEKKEPMTSYDINELYQEFQRNEAEICRNYLLKRHISEILVETLISNGIVVHNHYQGRSFCCFAVHDAHGKLKCLDNHAVDGSSTFVLGSKSVFTLDWELLSTADVVFVCEGIIDYLSIKSLENTPPPGIALLGNQLCFESSLLNNADVILSALDDDKGGDSAVLDLHERYPGKEIRIYDLEGKKDPNELLSSVRSGKGRKLNAEKKLQLYREFQKSENRTELARKWGIDRSYLYEVVRECEKILQQGLSESQVGRPSKDKPKTYDDALKQIEDLKKKQEKETAEREKLYCRSEFLKLRLKWSEKEVSELSNEEEQKNTHVKKKEKEETVNKIQALKKECTALPKDRIIEACLFSRSQVYRWLRGEQMERKEREKKSISVATAINTASVIGMFPHFGGRKGQAYMLYHELGYVGMKMYDKIKKIVKKLLFQEVSSRNLLPAPPYYEHIRPEKPGEIWAEDFTEIAVDGQTFKIAVVLDVFNNYYEGAHAAQRPSVDFVEKPVLQAIEHNNGAGPEKFLLCDNGKQYISEDHRDLLSSYDIIQRRIPSCTPQYNGTAEGGMKEIKSVFYNFWERRRKTMADEKKWTVDQIREVLSETIDWLNNKIPRPALGGVTPADVHYGKAKEKIKQIHEYREHEESREVVNPWKRNNWHVLKSGLRLKDMPDNEVLTKLDFFCRKPLRRIAERNKECVG